MSRSIATRTGDDGTTSLLYGQRVPKDHPQIEAVGAFDEFNAALGFAKSTCSDGGRRAEFEAIQRDLVSLMGEVACAESDAERYAASKFAKVGEADLARVDTAIAALEAQNLSFAGWATPGGNLHAAAIDLAQRGIASVVLDDNDVVSVGSRAICWASRCNSGASIAGTA